MKTHRAVARALDEDLPRVSAAIEERDRPLLIDLRLDVAPMSPTPL